MERGGLPHPLSQSIWRELATKIRFEVSQTAVFNPSRHTFYPSPEQFDSTRKFTDGLKSRFNSPQLTSSETLQSVCCNPHSVLLSVYFVCQCLSRQIVCSTTQSWFSSEKRWVESFQSNVAHFAPLVPWHNSIDNVFKPTVFSFCQEKESKNVAQKTRKPLTQTHSESEHNRKGPRRGLIVCSTWRPWALTFSFFSIFKIKIRISWGK